MRNPLWKSKFEEFVGKANTQSPYHSLDKDRWNIFVCCTLRAKIPFSYQEIMDELLGAGFPAEIAEELAERYETQREILRHYPRGPNQSLLGAHLVDA